MIKTNDCKIARNENGSKKRIINGERNFSFSKIGVVNNTGHFFLFLKSVLRIAPILPV